MALNVKDDITFYNLELKQLFPSNSRCAWLIFVGLQNSISGNVQSIKNSMKIMEWSEARHDCVWRSNELLVALEKGEHSDPCCLSALKQMKMRFNSKETCKAKEDAIV